MKWFFYKVRRT